MERQDRSQVKSKVKGVGQECPTHTSIAKHTSFADLPAFVCDERTSFTRRPSAALGAEGAADAEGFAATAAGVAFAQADT
jgi:hypothetical protein